MSPKLPNFIYMAVHEIEQRVFEEGIYRINGSRDECDKLKKKFLGGTVTPQHLKGITDTNTICSSIKDFFRNMITEPIITYKLLPKAINAFDNNDHTILKECILEVS